MLTVVVKLSILDIYRGANNVPQQVKVHDSACLYDYVEELPQINKDKIDLLLQKNKFHEKRYHAFPLCNMIFKTAVAYSPLLISTIQGHSVISFLGELLPKCSFSYTSNCLSLVIVYHQVSLVPGAHLGFPEGRGPNFRKGANQYKTKKKHISVITFC